MARTDPPRRSWPIFRTGDRGGRSNVIRGRMVKALKLFLWGLLILGVAILCYGANVLFSPFKRPPPIVRDLPAAVWQATDMFEKRVLDQFDGLSVAELRTELEEQGFDVDAGKARFFIDAFPCRKTWTIYWQGEDRAEDVRGIYNLACL